MNGCNGVDGQFHGGAKEHVLPVRVGPGGGGVLGRTVMSRRWAQTTNVDVNDGWLECCNSLGHLIARFKWNIRATSTVVDPGNVVLDRGGPTFGDVFGQRGMLSQIPLRSTWPSARSAIGNYISVVLAIGIHQRPRQCLLPGMGL